MHGRGTGFAGDERHGQRVAIRFGKVEVDPSTRLMIGPADAIRLEPRVLQVLSELAASPGDVVTRSHLFDRCWNGGLVGDDSLNRAVFELRRALRAVGGEWTIETIPRTGYRLTSEGDASTPPTAPDLPEIPPNPQHRVARRWLLGGVVATAGAAGLWYRLPASRRDARVDALVERGDLARRNDLPDAAEQGIGFYRTALKLAPDDAAIRGKLALALVAVAEYADASQEAQAVAAASSAIAEALARDARQPEALVAQAMLPPHYGEWLTTERALRRVLAIAPGNEAASEMLSILLMEVGRVTEGGAIIDRLVRAQPLSPAYNYRHVYQLWARGRLAEADRVADQSLQLWPRHSGVWLARFWTFATTDRAAAALAMLDDPNRADLPPRLATVLRVSARALLSRRPEDIAAARATNLAVARMSPFGVVNATLTLPPLGETETAFEINRGYLARTGPVVGALRRPAGQTAFGQQNRRKTQSLWMPPAAPLRADKRFSALCEATGLAAYWRRAGHSPDFRAGGAMD